MKRHGHVMGRDENYAGTKVAEVLGKRWGKAKSGWKDEQKENTKKENLRENRGRDRIKCKGLTRTSNPMRNEFIYKKESGIRP